VYFANTYSIILGELGILTYKDLIDLGVATGINNPSAESIIKSIDNYLRSESKLTLLENQKQFHLEMELMK